jgi:DNA polymerase elongation subunit (family B)
MPAYDRKEYDSEYESEPEYEKGKITAHAYHFKVEDNPSSGRSDLSIWAIGRGEDRYLLRHRSCPIFCYIALPRYVAARPAFWNSGACSEVYEWLRKELGKNNSDDMPINFLYQGNNKEIYNYQPKRKTPTMLVHFKNKKAMSNCFTFLNRPHDIPNYGLTDLKMWESNIDMVRKYFSINECKYTQWFNVEGDLIPLGDENRTAVAGRNNRIQELFINYEDIMPIDRSKTKGWLSTPDVLAFDIETYSPNHKKMPDKLAADNVAYMIQAVYQTNGQRPTRRRYAILIGDCKEVQVGDTTMVTVDGKKHILHPEVEIYRVKTEPELVGAYAEVVCKCDPDVITGYNIMSYDYEFLDVRLGMFYMEKWPQMGRLEGKTPIMNKREWKSGAYGHNLVCDLQQDGRLNIDLLPIVKRNYKFEKYTLDFVCRHFLKRGKHPVKAEQMFETFEFMEAAKKLISDMGNKDSITIDSAVITRAEVMTIWDVALDQMTTVLKYGVEDSELCIDLFEKLNVWVDLVEMASIVGVTITDLFTRGQQIRCQSQIYDEAMKSGYILNKRFADTNTGFTGGHTGVPTKGVHDNILCLDFRSLYPSIIIAYNICYTTFVPKEYDDEIPDCDCNIFEFKQEENVLAKKGSNEEEDNPDEREFNVNNVEAEAEEDTEEKIVMKKYRYRFVKKEKLEGILPRLLSNLVGERNKVKGQIKKTGAQHKTVSILLDPGKDKFGNNAPPLSERILDPKVVERCNAEINKYYEDKEEKISVEENLHFYKRTLQAISEDLALQLIIMDKRQNGLKVSANSMFGFLGVRFGGILPFLEGAMCITARGRKLIQEVNDYLKDKYNAKVIYGDTDSTMFDLGITDPKECYTWGMKLADEISGTPEVKDETGKVIKEEVKGLFPPPLGMEFEKAMRILLFDKKKKYAYLPIEKDGSFEVDDDGELVIVKKGVVPARRDNCAYLRDNYNDMLKHILLKNSMETSFNKYVDCVLKLYSGSMPPRGNLTVVRELGANYKSESYFLRVFSVELARVGKNASPGERLEYVVVKTDEEIEGKVVKLGHKMRDIDMWEDSWTHYNGKTHMVVEKETNGTLDSLPEAFAKILGVKTSKNENPNYPAEDIDYLYYVEHSLMNPLDQLFNIAYTNVLPKYEGIGYTPQYSRCHYCSMNTPFKMMGKLITDLIKGEHPLSEILETIAGLKDFLVKGMGEVDAIEEEEARENERIERIKVKVKRRVIVNKNNNCVTKIYKKEEKDIIVKKVQSSSEEVKPKKNKKKVESSSEEVKEKKNKKKVEPSSEEVKPKNKKKVESSSEEVKEKKNKKKIIIKNNTKSTSEEKPKKKKAESSSEEEIKIKLPKRSIVKRNSS